MKTLLKCFAYRGKEYTIVKDDDGYTKAIDFDYIDDSGHLTQRLNGIQMFVDLNDQSLNGILNRIKDHLDFNAYIEEAMINIEDDVEFCKALHTYYVEKRCPV